MTYIASRAMGLDEEQINDYIREEFPLVLAYTSPTVRLNDIIAMVKSKIKSDIQQEQEELDSPYTENQMAQLAEVEVSYNGDIWKGSIKDTLSNLEDIWNDHWHFPTEQEFIDAFYDKALPWLLYWKGIMDDREKRSDGIEYSSIITKNREKEGIFSYTTRDIIENNLIDIGNELDDKPKTKKLLESIAHSMAITKNIVMDGRIHQEPTMQVEVLAERYPKETKPEEYIRRKDEYGYID